MTTDEEHKLSEWLYNVVITEYDLVYILDYDDLEYFLYMTNKIYLCKDMHTDPVSDVLELAISLYGEL